MNPQGVYKDKATCANYCNQMTLFLNAGGGGLQNSTNWVYITLQEVYISSLLWSYRQKRVE